MADNGWSEHKLHVEKELERHSEWLKSINNSMTDIRTELAGFKGRVYGWAAGISAAITVIIKLIWS